MSATLIISVLAIYFGVLILISYLTSRNADSETFFTGNKQSPWYLVAFGMIGASLSGVTFISVPGKVYAEGMAYFQIVLGYVLGYLVIAQVLMPLYYRLNVTSIYEYLQKRFGVVSYKTGAGFFILSRTLGSATRLYLATVVLQLFLFEDLGVDAQVLEVDIFGLFDRITSTKTTNGGSMTQIFFFDDPNSKIYFPKQFFGGMFLAIAMTGLDQDLMQKNLTCRSIGDAKKNMYSFTTVLVITNFLFLLLGGALYVYAESKGVSLPMKGDKVITDHVFPTLALNNFGTTAGVFFLLGITASSYASADSALAALTTGFCIDFLNFHKRQEKQRQRLKLYVHIGFSLLFLIIILLTKWYVDSNPGTDLIGLILTVAGYTYGPLLGLFFFGILTKRKLMEWAVPIVCVLAPLLCYWFDKNSESLLNGYKFGNELLIMNGVLTFTGLALISKKQEH